APVTGNESTKKIMTHFSCCDAFSPRCFETSALPVGIISRLPSHTWGSNTFFVFFPDQRATGLNHYVKELVTPLSVCTRQTYIHISCEKDQRDIKARDDRYRWSLPHHVGHRCARSHLTRYHQS
ncbi:unnamed protein product, partial [Ectocarpus sp. 12 AP-2014]